MLFGFRMSHVRPTDSSVPTLPVCVWLVHFGTALGAARPIRRSVLSCAHTARHVTSSLERSAAKALSRNSTSYGGVKQLDSKIDFCFAGGEGRRNAHHTTGASGLADVGRQAALGRSARHGFGQGGGAEPAGCDELQAEQKTAPAHVADAGVPLLQ